MANIASSVTKAFDSAPDDTMDASFSDWAEVIPRRNASDVIVSEDTTLEALGIILDYIERQGGEVFGAVYATARVNPYSVVVTTYVSSPFFGVQKLGRVAFDPDEIVIAIVGDGEQKVFLAEEYVAIWLAAVTVLSRPRDQRMETAHSLAAECLEDR